MRGTDGFDLADWCGLHGETSFADLLACQASETTNTPVPDDLPLPSTLVMRGLAALGYTFRLNLCDNVIEVNGQPLDDILEAEITTHAWDGNVKPKGLIKPAYTTDAAQHAYHPVKEYLPLILSALKASPKVHQKCHFVTDAWGIKSGSRPDQKRGQSGGRSGAFGSVKHRQKYGKSVAKNAF